MLLTANGVRFNWNKHKVMERVRWLPLSLRGGMASRFLHGWKVSERGRNTSVRCEQTYNGEEEKEIIIFVLLYLVQIKDDEWNICIPLKDYEKFPRIHQLATTVKNVKGKGEIFFFDILYYPMKQLWTAAPKY